MNKDSTSNVWLRFVRPANIITSVSDVLAGIAIAGFFAWGTGKFLLQQTSSGTGGPAAIVYPGSADLSGHTGFLSLLPLVLLCLSTACLYAGGIVFNDIFDLKTDTLERPERVLPAGLISMRAALLAGTVLLGTGILFAAFFSVISGLIAAAIAIVALVYDKFGKHLRLLGPLNMGLCRGLNLLLGMSIVPAAMEHWGLIALIPVFYIYAITMISRGEVSGGSRASLYLACLLYLLVIASIAGLSFFKNALLPALVFILPFAWVIVKPLLKAIAEPVGRNIGLAVRGGILALILMDAAWAAAFGQLLLAFIIVLLLPLSIWLANRFAVT